MTSGVKVTQSDWNRVFQMVTLENTAGLKVKLLSLGATIHSVEFPGTSEPDQRDVILGFDDAAGYDGTGNRFFWGTTGRLTNRVKNGRFCLDGVEYQLTRNDGGTEFRHHVHGGATSFDRLDWITTPIEGGVAFSTLSPDGSEGYPGNMIASVTYTLDEEGNLAIAMQAMADRATIVNLSNHVYFNLAGHATGWHELGRHLLTIPHHNFTPDDSDYLPTGEVANVAGTEYDLSSGRLLEAAVPAARGGEGYCVNYCIPQLTDGQLSLAAVLSHPPTGRQLEVWSDQPGLELYTGNFLPDEKESGLLGKRGATYHKWGGLCLMTQNYRDAPNHENFPTAVLRPGEIYSHKVIYKFSWE